LKGVEIRCGFLIALKKCKNLFIFNKGSNLEIWNSCVEFESFREKLKNTNLTNIKYKSYESEFHLYPSQRNNFSRAREADFHSKRFCW